MEISKSSFVESFPKGKYGDLKVKANFKYKIGIFSREDEDYLSTKSSSPARSPSLRGQKVADFVNIYERIDKYLDDNGIFIMAPQPSSPVQAKCVLDSPKKRKFRNSGIFKRRSQTITLIPSPPPFTESSLRNCHTQDES
jgi:hypothetical protein